MKLLFRITCLFLLTSGMLHAQPSINFRPVSFQDALNAGAAENKNILLMTYQSTCSHCEKMLNEVFPDTSIGNFYNAHYVCIKEDLLDQEKAKFYLKKFYITSFPTFIIVNPSGELLYQYVGEFKADEFVKQGRLALDPKNQIPAVRSQFDANRTDSIACYQYLLVLSRGRLSTQQVANQYFNANNKQLEFSFANWRILSMSVSDMESDVFKYIIAHQSDFAAVATQKKVDRKIFLTAAYNLQSPASANDTLVYFRNRNAAAQLHIKYVDSLIFVNDLTVYEKNKQWDKYIATAKAGGEAFAWTDGTLLRRMSEAMYDHGGDAGGSPEAIKFITHSVELIPNYASEIMAAKIYLKTGDKATAQKYATTAKDMGMKSNMNLSEVNLILQQCDEH